MRPAEGAGVIHDQRKLFVLNGPNLNMLGLREPELYGTATLDDVRLICDRVARELGFELFFAQSNAEHEIVEWVHDAFRQQAIVVINPAGFSFRSVPLLDALQMLVTPRRRGAHHEHPCPRCRLPALAHLVGRARGDRGRGRVRIRAGDPRRRPVGARGHHVTADDEAAVLLNSGHEMPAIGLHPLAAGRPSVESGIRSDTGTSTRGE